ncbi:probable pinoresinol-lariciresinol reductase 3 [Typha latifolia]|uniref:probable pinoresinol-lariciresinol reductase 3 n=1 Tax=Typha latifolia TaxID=4733 RepID=UPI003C2EEA5D
MAMEENDKSRVLVIGATGRLGQELIRASLAASHPTFALVRETTFSDHGKSLLLRSFESQGVTLLKGSLEDLSSLLEAVRQVDVVICAIPSKLVLEQKLLIRAIKETNCIKRFIPSEFGADPSKVQVLNIDNGFYEKKLEIRRCIEKEGIPYTYICCNFFMRYLLPSLIQPGLEAPPRDEIKIFGNGDIKAVFVKESDVAIFTICTIDDPRTLNRTLYLRPPGNVCSMNELVKIWEMKIGKELKRVYVSEEQLLRSIHGTPFPMNMDFVFIYSSFVKGDHTYFNIDLSGFDGTHLYSHVKHTIVSDFLDTLV